MKDLNSIDPEWAWAPFVPGTHRPWDRRAVAHLYRRAGFGAIWEELNQGVKLGVIGAVQKLLNAKSSSALAQESAPKATVTMGGMMGSAMAGSDPRNLGAWWLYRMLYSEDQLLEKLTLFWHGHFATSAAKVTDADMMRAHDALLRRHARGDFGKLVQGMAKDPAMLVWLDSTSNRKRRPNENFARELMELFCWRRASHGGVERHAKQKPKAKHEKNQSK